MIRATHTGTLFAGLMDCYVAEDGRAFVSKRGLLRALRGAENTENSADPNRGDLDRYLSRLPANLLAEAADPNVKMSLPGGRLADAISEARATEIVAAYVEAAIEGLLRADQRNLARGAHRMQKALASVGLRALVYEATGFDQSLHAAARDSYCARMLLAQPRLWEITFYPTLVSSLSRLYGYSYTPGSRHPSGLQRMNGILYDLFLGSEAYAALRARVPGDHVRNHQLLTDAARIAFGAFLAIVEAFANISGGPDELRRKLNTHYNREPYQLPLPGAA